MTFRYNLKSGGSGKGFSYYSAATKCPRRAELAAESEVRSENLGEALVCGILFHGFADLYHNQLRHRIDPRDVAFHYEEDGQPVGGNFIVFREEVNRVWSQYQGMVPPEGLGEPVGAEIDLITPQTPVQQKIEVYRTLGVSPWTGRVDFVSYVDEELAEKLLPETGFLLSEGRYIWDHKVHGSERSEYKDTYPDSTQLMSYILAWNITNPHKKVEGGIINAVIRTKTIKLRKYFVPVPDVDDIKSIAAFYTGAQNMLKVLGTWANRETCHSYGKWCPYMGNKCKRY